MVTLGSPRRVAGGAVFAAGAVPPEVNANPRTLSSPLGTAISLSRSVRNATVAGVTPHRELVSRKFNQRLKLVNLLVATVPPLVTPARVDNCGLIPVTAKFTDPPRGAGVLAYG
jgi:hypothetical protein